ncbi:MAG: hypothetical protein JSV17_09675 [Candidatus Aminicenantes bacterium]|nr:MAG: hypothetical protein JSV17_09675 [Candidatus Aminicenantes bacterium]
MIKRSCLFILAIVIIWAGFCATLHLHCQDTAEVGKILGDWEMEVDAGGEYFYLSFFIEKTDSGFKGAISESSGFFSEVPLENIEFDGSHLRFETNIPTPPDGYENLVKADLELAEEKLEGTLSVESLGISAPATATKKDGS